uniref:Delta 5 fatty acid desaturase putative n=1 Tax=Albugo laibachii Nc14 TaxID=890382 RepID=F0WXX8_9STRA|nr:delta 5 fatty acid desaturase putative [Albugo laibachii Nc14]|eukprot:CCA26326.1 delta 5 fatty acid desaturase putative [Albugo laibachii Nc14]
MALSGSYKREKEDFVSHTNGTTAFEVFHLFLLMPGTLWLYSEVILWLEVNGIGPWKKQVPPMLLTAMLELGMLVMPTLLIFTVTELATPLVLFVYSVAFVLNRRLNSRMWNNAIVDRIKSLSKLTQKQLPFVTCFRSQLMISTCIAILAVDFQIFPRRLAKTETFGFSVMDIGVGSFLLSSGLVSPFSRNVGTIRKNIRSLTHSRTKRFYNWIRPIIAVLAMGLARVWAVKAVEYQEHVTEYGVHWNFYFSLATVYVLHSILEKLGEWAVSPWSAIALLVGYQYFLSNLGGSDLILQAPRTNWFLQNREGILSITSYESLYLFATAIGRWIFSTSKLDNLKGSQVLAPQLLLLSIVLAISCWISNVLIESPSRRMVNLPYVLWVLATAVFLLSVYSFIYAYSAFPRIPLLFEGISQNLLLVFIVANIMTGVVNLSMKTIYASSAAGIVTIMAPCVVSGNSKADMLQSSHTLISRKSLINGKAHFEEIEPVPSQPSYTWQEVAEHNTPESAWLIVRGKVYDVTKWAARHPGGEEFIWIHAGRECTAAFDSYHPFSQVANTTLRKFLIGELVGQTEFITYPQDSGFYRECCERVKEYFDTNKLDPKCLAPGAWRTLVLLSLAIVAFFGMHAKLLMSDNITLRCFWAILFGIIQALTLLHIMHDCSHAAHSKSPFWWKFMGRASMDWFAGASMIAWQHQHILGHHIYTNIASADPDLPTDFDRDLRRIVALQTKRAIYRFQHIYLPPLYGLLALKVRLQDFYELFLIRSNGPIRVNPISTSASIAFIASKAFWVIYRILVPLFVFKIPAATFWRIFLVTEFVTGWYLALNFQVSHISTACKFPTGSKQKTEEQDEWAISQVKTSVDYSHNSAVATFLSGSLNYQITHHLFPSISQYHYPAIAPIIMQLCKKYKVPYCVLTSFTSAMSAHLKHLKEMGRLGKGH